MFAIYNVKLIYSSPHSWSFQQRAPTGTQGEGRERDRGQQRGRVENALTGERAGPAVSRDNWDTVYYRLRAIYAVRGV